MNVNHSNNDNKFASNKNNKKLVEEISLYGMDIKILVTGDMTNDKYSLVEISFPAGPEKEVALHKHSKEDVTIYIIEGNFVFKYGDKELKKGLGVDDTPFRLEKNIPHSYKKIGEEKGILLILFRPAGFENFFRDVGRSSVRLDFDKKIDEEYKPQNRKMEEDDRVLLHLLEQKYGGRFVFEQDR